jgi:hypothetical protein
LFAAWIPNLLSMPPILHVVEMDIEAETDAFGDDSLTVVVAETGEVSANARPLTLQQLVLLADKMKSADSSVVLDPDPCAPYDMVIKTVVALKIAGPSHLGFAKADYSTSFGKASDYPSDPSLKRMQPDDCRNKAFPARKLHAAG